VERMTLRCGGRFHDPAMKAERVPVFRRRGNRRW
jgi:hypothetical protein